jgi:hypothetical protein
MKEKICEAQTQYTGKKELQFISSATHCLPVGSFQRAFHLPLLLRF